MLADDRLKAEHDHAARPRCKLRCRKVSTRVELMDLYTTLSLCYRQRPQAYSINIFHVLHAQAVVPSQQVISCNVCEMYDMTKKHVSNMLKMTFSASMCCILMFILFSSPFWQVAHRAGLMVISVCPLILWRHRVLCKGWKDGFYGSRLCKVNSSILRYFLKRSEAVPLG